MSDIIFVTKAKFVAGNVIDLTFSDGLRAEVDFSIWVQKYPFFAPLKDPDYFQNFSLDGWTVVWPNGADIAPETLHAVAVSNAQREAA
ncbi:DUF2442 domain-containing protein [soil metagenome]